MCINFNAIVEKKNIHIKSNNKKQKILKKTLNQLSFKHDNVFHI